MRATTKRVVYTRPMLQLSQWNQPEAEHAATQTRTPVHATTSDFFRTSTGAEGQITSPSPLPTLSPPRSLSLLPRPLFFGSCTFCGL